MSREASPLRDKMIFLVGARRSGTNWLQRVVGAHPDVAVVPSETYLFSRGIAPLLERFHHGVRNSPSTGSLYMDADDLTDALREFCDHALLPFLRADPVASRLAERTPEHVAALDTIGRVYPDAHIVHIIRDGRDVARSLLSQPWPSAPKTMEAAAAEWRDCVDAAATAATGLRQYRVVKYEEMLADPLPHVTALYEWLGLLATGDVVEGALREAEVAYNVDRSAPVIGAGKWRSSYSAEDLETFMRIAGEALVRNGYPVTDVEPPGAEPAAPPEDEPRRKRFGRRDKAGPAVDPDKAFSAEITRRTEALMRRLDRVVSAVTQRRPQLLDEMVSPNLWVRCVGDDDDWTRRGAPAWEAFKEAVSTDTALAGRQKSGEPYVSLPTSSAVMIYDTGDGKLHARILVVTFRGETITRITYYRLPLAA